MATEATAAGESPGTIVSFVLSIHRRDREAFSAAELGNLQTWLEAAYGDPPGSWEPDHWSRIGSRPHFMIEDDDGQLVSHACVCLIVVEAAGRPLHTAYVEDVATRSDRRGEGFASALLAGIDDYLEAEMELGALSTGSPSFYRRHGWELWSGPSWVCESDGRLTPTPDEEGNIMVRRGHRTPADLPPDGSIIRPRRDQSEAW